MSAAYLVKKGGGNEPAKENERVLDQKSLGEGLGLQKNGKYFTVFRGQITGLEYIRKCSEIHEKGLFVELGAYKYQVFLDLVYIIWYRICHFSLLSILKGFSMVKSCYWNIILFFLVP